jgi:ubiquinone/menaquinone biosynthesis C-methylase UbiE
VDNQTDIVVRHFNQYAATWHERLRQYPFRARRESVRELLSGHTPHQVVDIGCGTGDYAVLFDLKHTRYLGLDISPEMIAVCRRLYPDYRFEVGDGQDTGLPGDSMDVVLSVAVLEYLDSPDEHLAETRRLIRPSGMVIVSVPNADNVSKRRDRLLVKLLSPLRRIKRFLMGPEDTSASSYVKDKRVTHRKYSQAQMRSLGLRHGLKLTKTQFVNYEIVPAFLDKFLGLNPRLSAKLSGRRGRVGRWLATRYATILVCLFQQEDSGQL